MTAIDIEQLVTFVDKMPAFRGSVHRLLQLASDIDADNREIVHVIESDPLMTVKVLKVVNSPFFGLASKISSVQRAVVHLGMNSIKNMALCVAAIGVLPDQNQAGFNNREFLLHSLTSASLCKLLGDRLQIDPAQTSDYFVAGLLHDFGKIVFAEFVPATYKKVLQTASEQMIALHQVESEVFGMDHSQTGKLLAEHWGLSDSLVVAIDHHHNEYSHAALSDCLFAANQISKQLKFGFAGNPVIRQFPPGLKRRFGMDLDALVSNLGDLSHIKTQALAFID